jgi:hypothetical protein
MPRKEPVADRFNRMYTPEPNSGCWLWLGYCTKNGYGRIGVWGKRGTVDYAHRISYELFNGPIPNHLTVDHKCRVRCCVNPDHLRLLTLAENTLAGENFVAKQARQTHCRYGHPLFGDNLVMERNTRQCRVCKRRREIARLPRPRALR